MCTLSIRGPHRRAQLSHINTQRAALLLPLVSVMLAVIVGCSDPYQPSPVTKYQVLTFDVSGSTVKSGATRGYAARARQLIATAGDGTLVVLGVADGASQSSTCIAREIVLQAEGKNITQARDDLEADRALAAHVVDQQLACGTQVAAPGSDLVGAILAADRSVPAGSGPRTVVTLFSDGMQASDVRLSKRNLANPAKLRAIVHQLAKAGLLPVNLKGATLQITDPAVGAELTATQAHGVLQFWQDYAAAAGMTLR